MSGRSLYKLSSSASQPIPYVTIDRQRLHPVRLQVNKGSMMLDHSIPNQPSQQSKCVVGEGLVHKAFRTFDGLQYTRTGLTVLVERWIKQLRKNLWRSPKAHGATAVAPVPRLAEHELPARCVVAQTLYSPVMASQDSIRQFAGG